jgi:hypothetical protein
MYNYENMWFDLKMWLEFMLNCSCLSKDPGAINQARLVEKIHTYMSDKEAELIKKKISILKDKK